MKLVEKLFGTYSSREIKLIQPTVDRILGMRDEMVALSDEELRAKTDEYKKRYQEGETLDDLLPEAFATVREAARRVLNMEPFPVQIMGGIILHMGRIAEMRTGEGKTLVSTLPAYLNALTGEGVHIVTVNDYLAKRDSDWMGQVHRFLGLTCGCVLNSMEKDERRVNAKSLLGVLSLGIVKGTTITLIADGNDEKEAVQALVELVQNNFDE